MLRLLSQRRAAALASAAVLAHESRDKLPIYPAPAPEVLLLDAPSGLETQIGAARTAATATYRDARAQVQAVVSRWIGVEHAVEARIKSLVDPTEPLTPGVLYVGVATLSGSILARTRALPARLLLPPVLLVLSARHFLPKTAANVAAYLGSLEDTYLPALAEKHDIANAHSAMTWERLKEAGAEGRVRFERGVLGAVERLEAATGLKLKDALGKSAAVETQVREAAGVVRQSGETAAAAVAEKVEAVREAIEEKVHDVRAAAEEREKADELPKRLV
ncbi:hypothetical protein WOLCODRAFT_138052 [Wolfiporia cocos MD-104 SS10]|uniref:MICOS complex subunit n=1 Tax=Wolfiporia cocos (strain MD-104) TaxID=742152 RepID=A0A2H3JKM3_WOLCO|nr:hypothetical protein WOLCODRAFT_138052 [Wolfiporia cocos MD-104 SS10]